MYILSISIHRLVNPKKYIADKIKLVNLATDFVDDNIYEDFVDDNIYEDKNAHVIVFDDK